MKRIINITLTVEYNENRFPHMFAVTDIIKEAINKSEVLDKFRTLKIVKLTNEPLDAQTN